MCQTGQFDHRTNKSLDFQAHADFGHALEDAGGAEPGEAGERVVTAGVSYLREGQKVKLLDNQGGR